VRKAILDSPSQRHPWRQVVPHYSLTHPGKKNSRQAVQRQVGRARCHVRFLPYE